MPEEEIKRLRQDLEQAAKLQVEVLLKTYIQLWDKVPGNSTQEKLDEINRIVMTTTQTMKTNTEQFTKECLKTAGVNNG